jgi:5-methylcytosine-specific restriction endonuclease McrA
MIEDGMSEMGGSSPAQDDLDVNVQPLIDAVPEMSIASFICGAEWTDGDVPTIRVGDIVLASDMTPLPDPPWRRPDVEQRIETMNSTATPLADKPVSIVVDMNAARARRGTTNQNARGNAADRARRRAWLVETYRADRDVEVIYGQADLYGGPAPFGMGEAACRCYRCGTLLTVDTVTIDRIIPGCRGGTYRRNNIRPACSSCNSITGSTTRKR